MFDSVENTAVVRDCVFIVNNHTPGALFARNQADFTVENVAFIGNYNIEAENLLRGTSDGKPHSQKQICEEWLISRTTLNTIVKECIEKGYLTLQANAHSKEKQILLTESGRQYASKLLGFLYRAEEAAIKETLDRHGDAFITALEDFADSFLEKIQ